jgi:NTP pyrophosphatase (non-canonical NTP hydrolase)
MRKRPVTDQELDQVIKLRQAGASWLRIQRETGIPRRTAQRAHGEWERTRSSDELKRARTDVAAEEFRDHLNDLTALAQFLVNSLCIPMPMGEVDSVEQVLEPLWKREIRQERTQSFGEKEKRRTARRNKMLLRSLQDHTREKVRWQALEEWRQALASYIKHCKSLRSEGRKMLGDILGQRAELGGRIKAMTGGKEVLEDMVKGVVEAVWRGILAGRPVHDNVFMGTSRLSNAITEVSFGKGASRTSLQFTDGKLAEEVADVCRWAASNLCQGTKSDLLREIAVDIGTMEKRGGELEEMLDALVLRPMILRTRCDLCPA